MKVMDKRRCRGHESHIIREITILKKINHKNIIKLYDCFETKDRLYLQMEFRDTVNANTHLAPSTNSVDGGELFDRICDLGSYGENDARRIVSEVLEAVKYLHGQNIVHRDLKPENLLMASKAPNAHVKLADFGLSTVMTNESMLSTKCGTLTYVAPEVLKGLDYGKPVDLWSIGVITYILLSGYPPFWAEDEAAILELTLRTKFSFFSPDWDEITPLAKDFISNLIVADPSARLTAQQAATHRWIKGGGETELVDLSARVGENLIKHFDAKRKFKASIDAVMFLARHIGHSFTTTGGVPHMVSAGTPSPSTIPRARTPTGELGGKGDESVSVTLDSARSPSAVKT
ncbi:calcium calmodulin-dependent protein kinase type 1G [Borealophlyctis nickersoniae]|nr:calcium calmodulin-dependent protein kinase type 1G [Borealophlyctis nickersoniae]